MFTAFESRTLSDLSINDKRALVNQLKAAIKNDLVQKNAQKVNEKIRKENAKKNRVLSQIQAAQDKLAKLQAKLV